MHAILKSPLTHRNIMTATKNKTPQTFYTYHNPLTSHIHMKKSYSANYFYSHWALLNGLIYNAVEEPCRSFLLQATFNFFLTDQLTDLHEYTVHIQYSSHFSHHIFSPLAISIRIRKSTFFHKYRNMTGKPVERQDHQIGEQQAADELHH